MKKALTLITIMALMAFQPSPKSYKIDLTPQEVQIIYDALGELPAKQTEAIRFKLIQQVTEQNKADKK
jgi:hypothetical protein